MDPMHFFGIPLIRQEGRMQVAIAHVPEGADAKPVLLGHLIHKADHPGQFAARHGGILQNGRRRHPGQCTEG